MSGRPWLRPTIFCFAMPCWLAACLTSQNLGAFDEPCGDPTQAKSDEERQICMSELVERLSHTRWVGEGHSGELSAPILFEFGRDGSYRVTSTGDTDDNRADFGSMFLSPEPTAAGTYVITDLVEGAFFGRATRTGRNVAVPGDLEHLVLDGENLSFSLHFPLFLDFSTIATDLMLTRQR